jgi:hypothetical protein
MDSACHAVDGWWLACKPMDLPDNEEEDEAPPRSKRGAVAIFLIGWLALPGIVLVLGELQAPWLQIGIVATLAFIALLIGAMVRVVRRF